MSKTNLTLKLLVLIAILANMVGMYYPLVTSTFSPYYGSIAKQIVVSNNWYDLMFCGHDWLDKPHLPFWLTAISYKFLGIHSYSYILPGFIFYLFGLVYTYRLAKHFYNSQTGWLAVLFTVTALHLLLSAIDVRAEAYLIGTIMPACYYWLMYDLHNKKSALWLGAIFSALALMTKGPFVMVTIISGIAMLWIYQGKYRNFISVKWIVALILSFILIFPELIALYHQFDANPQKYIYGHTNVSGIKWYFWGSQFGRFFNTGAIVTTNPPPLHLLFYVYTFFWAYLPWWPIFYIALFGMIFGFKKYSTKHKEAIVYLLGSFFITFLMFSLTSFQVDHYTNILFPFASIICASYFEKYLKSAPNKILEYIELFLALVMLVVGFGAVILLIEGIAKIALFMVLGLALIILGFTYNSRLRTLIYPSIAISALFVVVTSVNGIAYARYDAGYQIAKVYNQQNNINIIGYQLRDLLSLDINSKNTYIPVDNVDQIDPKLNNAYIVANRDNQQAILEHIPNAKVVDQFEGLSIEAFLAGIIDKDHLTKDLKHFVVIKI